VNTTLPPSRDLPPGRHTEIRGELLAAVTPRQTRRWLAPIAVGATALVVVGLAVWFMPSGSGGGITPATQPTTTDPVATAPQAAPGMKFPDLTQEQVSAIEHGCVASAGLTEKVTLRQLLTDQAGRLAVLYGAKDVLDCELDGPAMPYNSGFSNVRQFVPPVSVDSNTGSAGGDLEGGKPEYAGRPGTNTVIGRISPLVARVTFTRGQDTVEAVLETNSSAETRTYVARIVHPANWEVPENQPPAVVRAYDKNGTLLGEITQ
jgi:hypothetical protein